MKIIKAITTTLTGALFSAVAIAQTMPTTPLPTGVVASTNPLDTGVSLFKKMAQYGFVGASIFMLLLAAYIAGPAMMDWVGGKKKFGEASGQIVGGLFLALFGIAIATYGFTQVGLSGAATP